MVHKYAMVKNMTEQTSIPFGLIEEYRDVAVDYDWWDDLYDGFTEKLEKAGIELDYREYTGHTAATNHRTFRKFCIYHDIQGLVTFDASICGADDWDKFLKAHPEVDKSPLVSEFIERCGDEFKFASHARGRYMTYDINDDWGVSFHSCVEEVNDSNEALLDWLDTMLEPELDNFEADVKQVFESYANGLLRELQDEYDYLTSDEYVIEYLTDNYTEDQLAEMAEPYNQEIAA